MTNQEAIEELQYTIDLIKQDGKDWLDERDIPVLEMAISALEKQEIKESGCIYKPNCTWYDDLKCNGPNDHGYHECDYDRWIPVSERLPEKYGNYLISIYGEDESDIGTISPNDKRGWSLCDAKGFHWASDQKLIITAWMPLPEPYRVERRTDGSD